MSNKLRDMFDPNSEYNKELKRKAQKMEQQMKNDKDCLFCANAELRPHIEMGREVGNDAYCTIHKELKLGYGVGQECLFWKERECQK